jgi:hypothetical protein
MVILLTMLLLLFIPCVNVDWLCLLCIWVLLGAEDIGRSTICLYIGVYLVPWGGLVFFLVDTCVSCSDMICSC